MMTRSRLTSIIAALAGAGMAVALATSQLPRKASIPLELKPLTGGSTPHVLEGEVASIRFELVNRRNQSQTVQVGSSCACIEVRGEDGGTLASHLSLGAKGSIVVEALFSTSWRSGPQRYELSAKTISSETFTARAPVEVYVISAMVAGASTVVFEESDESDAYRKTIPLLDMLPDPGSSVDRIETTGPLNTELLDAAPGETQVYAGIPMTVRHRAAIEWDPGRAAQDRTDVGSVRIFSTSPAGPKELRIDVSFQAKRPRIALTPERLSFAAGGREVRSALLAARDGSPMKVVRTEAPDFLSATVDPSGESTSLLRIRLADRPPADETRSEVRVFVEGQDEPLILAIDWSS